MRLRPTGELLHKVIYGDKRSQARLQTPTRWQLVDARHSNKLQVVVSDRSDIIVWNRVRCEHVSLTNVYARLATERGHYAWLALVNGSSCLIGAMDYLSIPQDAAHMLVPDLGGPDFGDEDFKDYDARHGWNFQHIQSGNLLDARTDWDTYQRGAVPLDELPEGVQIHSHLLAQFLQTWLFFGLLSQALGRRVFRKHYSKPAENAPYKHCITAKSFPGDFKKQVEANKANTAWVRRLELALFEAANILNAINYAEKDVSVANSLRLSGNLMLSIRCLLQTIVSMGNSMLKWSIHADSFNSPLKSNASLERHLVGLGWCPSQVSSLQSRLGESGLYYVSRMDVGPERHRHLQCSPDNCIAYNIEEHAYSAKHTKDCSRQSGQDGAVGRHNCHFVEAPGGELLSSLKGDRFPLISVSRVDGLIKINFTRYEEGIKYFAISHVWSDGLGNPSRNQLPACQLLALNDKVTRLACNVISEFSGTVVFWIDTICIPLLPPESRKAAIRRLARTFSRAQAVLVLSAELESMPIPSSNEQTLLQALCSKWMTRLWTFNEATNAGCALWAQFSDGQVNVEQLRRQACEAEEHTLEFRAAKSFEFNVIETKNDPNKAFLAAWHGVIDRSTSKPRDEAICLSQILGKDHVAPESEGVASLWARFKENCLPPILAKDCVAPEGEGMRFFWACFKELPIEILWLVGPRLKDVGYRWAPQSLLRSRGARGSIPQSVQRPAIPTPRGLLVEGIYGVWFGAVPTPDCHPLQFDTPAHQMVFVLTAVGEHTLPLDWESFRQSWSGKVALLWEWPPSPNMPSTAAVLLANCRSIDGVWHGDWLSSAIVFYRDSATCQAHFESGLLGGQAPVSRARMIGKDKKWCIS